MSKGSMVSRGVIIPSTPLLATVIWALLFLFLHLTVLLGVLLPLLDLKHGVT